MYPLLETIQIRDGVGRHLAWHQERMDRTVYELFGQRNIFSLKDLIQPPKNMCKGIVKCRLDYDAENWHTEYSPYISRKIEFLKLLEVNQLDYRYKFSNREELDFYRVQKGDCDEILMVIDGRISDTSYTNIVFFDGNGWFTPDSPLLEGTCRRRLIEEGKMVVTEIRPGDLEKYTHFRLINAMLDFDEQPMIGVRNIRK